MEDYLAYLLDVEPVIGVKAFYSINKDGNTVQINTGSFDSAFLIDSINKLQPYKNLVDDVDRRLKLIFDDSRYVPFIQMSSEAQTDILYAHLVWDEIQKQFGSANSVITDLRSLSDLTKLRDKIKVPNLVNSYGGDFDFLGSQLELCLSDAIDANIVASYNGEFSSENKYNSAIYKVISELLRNPELYAAIQKKYDVPVNVELTDKPLENINRYFMYGLDNGLTINQNVVLNINQALVVFDSSLSGKVQGIDTGAAYKGSRFSIMINNTQDGLAFSSLSSPRIPVETVTEFNGRFKEFLDYLFKTTTPARLDNLSTNVSSFGTYPAEMNYFLRELQKEHDYEGLLFTPVKNFLKELGLMDFMLLRFQGLDREESRIFKDNTVNIKFNEFTHPILSAKLKNLEKLERIKYLVDSGLDINEVYENIKKIKLSSI